MKIGSNKINKMNTEAKVNHDQFIAKLVSNLRPGSEGENIYEDEKELKFENIPLLKPATHYK
jgi:hypothetical protein